MKVNITLDINKKSKTIPVDPGWSLAFVLRNELSLTGTKVGCEMGACGACTVILEQINGTTKTRKAILACLMLAVDAKTTTKKKQTIWTIEGISSGNYLDPVQEHFKDNDAFQCGFCTPGFIMAGKALAEKIYNKGKTGYPSKTEVRKALAGHICTCGNLKKVIDTLSGKYYSWVKNWPIDPFGKTTGSGTWVRYEPRCDTVKASSIQDLSVIDNPYKTDQQAELIVRGDLQFGADFQPPKGKKLYARLLLATQARAKIKSINTSVVSSMPGVKAVLTYNECPTWGVINDEVIYWGQEIAAVAADDPNTAARAVKKLAGTVTYQKLNPGLDPDSLISGAIALPAIPVRGNINTGKSNSDLWGTFTQDWTSFFQHGSLETCSCLVWWQGNQLYIRSGTQGPHKARDFLWYIAFQLYKFLTLPQFIHFYTQGTGTAHGDKLPSEWCITAALLSWKAGAPVELSLSRRENFLTRTHQFQAKASIDIGAKTKGKDKGKIQFIDAQYWGSGGRNPVDVLQKGLPIKELPEALRTTYKCENAKFQAAKVFTNKPKCGWWRCVADSPGVFVEDIAMEKMAEKLSETIKITPYDFKFQNMAKDLVHQDNSKLVYSSNGLKECFEACANKIGLTKFQIGKGGVGTVWHKPRTANIWTDGSGRRHGVGIAAHMDSHGGLAVEDPLMMKAKVKAKVKLTTEGKIELDVGISRASGGTNTTFCHIVAEVLGINYDDIKTTSWGNTDKTLDGGIQGGSTRTITLGSAYQKAAEVVRKKLLTQIAGNWGVSDTKLKIENSRVIDTTYASTKNITIKDFMAGYKVDITGEGETWDKKLRKSITTSSKAYPIGHDCETRGVSASAVELLVDESTGEIEILKFVNAVDCGRAIFYEGAKKQIDSGIEIQLGQGLFYEQILDKSGVTVNPNFLDSKWPTTLDIDPDSHVPIIVETDDACGPYGAKGMGEPCVSNYVCIANAIFNAIGKWIYPPFYPQKVLKAVKSP